MSIPIVTLKNGAEEPKSFIQATILALEDLKRNDAISFYELVMCCRDEDHVPFGNTADKLNEWALYPIHDSIRNVVLSAVTGDGLEMKLESPV